MQKMTYHSERQTYWGQRQNLTSESGGCEGSHTGEKTIIPIIEIESLNYLL